MTSLLLFGGSGQVGTAIRASAGADLTVLAPSSRDVSLTDPIALRDFIVKQRPDVVVNAAAYTKVDDAETQRDAAFAINGTAPGVMAEASRSVGARFVHISTDYVFDGHGDLPYTTGAPTNPLNVYGASKLAGEHAVAAADVSAAIMRTAWVHSGGGVNFVATAVRVLGAGKSMRVVDDQVGAPTSAATLAHAALLLAAQRDVAGLLHVTDAGVAAWYDVACCVLETMRLAGRLPDSTTVTPVDSSAFSRPAKRPQVSILDTHASRAQLGWTPPHWREGVIASTQELLHA
jgi:dTDP-4-dehydrorhamnose reductase